MEVVVMEFLVGEVVVMEVGEVGEVEVPPLPPTVRLEEEVLEGIS
jgi:hypothetical protein